MRIPERRETHGDHPLEGSLEAVESVAVIAAAAAVVTVLLSDRATRAETNAAPSPPQPQDIRSQDASASIDTATTLGHEDADVALIEFGDYQCPFCGQLARETFPRLRKEFIDHAKLRFTYKHFPLENLHPLARAAARHAACAAEQSRFWDVHDRIFLARFSEEFLRNLPSDLKLDTAAFTKCLDRIDATIDADTQEGRRLGVSSTPMFFIGKIGPDGSVELITKLAGALPYATFAAEISSALKN
jgi:protein-disulfide isomerase